MSDSMKTIVCERGDDLISFLYGEASESEALDFKQHLTKCQPCRDEMASFNEIRTSISDWKQEAFAHLTLPEVITPVRKRSALVALREFFDLSPLWMKGAVGFASIAFCVMAVALVASINRPPTPTKTIVSDGKYSQAQVDQIVADALKKQSTELATVSRPVETQTIADKRQPKIRPTTEVTKSTQWASGRAPLSRSEREQLATDLRLSSTKEEDNLHLLGDRINQEF